MAITSTRPWIGGHGRVQGRALGADARGKAGVLLVVAGNHPAIGQAQGGTHLEAGVRGVGPAAAATACATRSRSLATRSSASCAWNSRMARWVCVMAFRAKVRGHTPHGTGWLDRPSAWSMTQPCHCPLPPHRPDGDGRRAPAGPGGHRKYVFPAERLDAVLEELLPHYRVLEVDGAGAPTTGACTTTPEDLRSFRRPPQRTGAEVQGALP